MGKRIDKTSFKVLELSIDMLEERLKAFEKKYGMDSKDFYRKYNRGELDESAMYDFIDWATFYEMASLKGSRQLTVA